MRKTSLIGTGMFFLAFPLLVIFFTLQSHKVSKEDEDYNNTIKFEFVDPLEKVLTEASYFPSERSNQ